MKKSELGQIIREEIKRLKESDDEGKIEYQKGKTHQKGKGWTVFKSGDDFAFRINVNSSAGWSTDPQDDRRETIRLMDAGKQRATLRFKEGNIDKFAQQMYDLNDETTWGEKQGLTAKDYADIIRVWIDMRMANKKDNKNMKITELRQIIREETIKIFESDNSKIRNDIKQFSKIKITKPLTHANRKGLLEPGEYQVNRVFRARNGFIMRLMIQNKKAEYKLVPSDLKGNMDSIELISENEQLDEISLKQGALAALLTLASFTGKAQDKVGPNIDNSKIASAVTNFQSAYRKTGDEKFNVGEDDVKTMTGKQFEELMLAAFAERGIMAKGSPELQQRIDSLQKAHGPEAQFKEVFKINYLAPVQNKSAFELAFAKAYKEGMDTFEFEGKTYKVEIDKTGKSTSGKVEVKILPAGERAQVNPQNESKLRKVVREALKSK